MRKLIILAVAAMALAMAVAGTASASVTFDPTTGTGFVGKGDIQTPFNWNDSKLQTYASGVTFKYSSIEDDAYAVTCEWDTESNGGGKDHTTEIKHHIANQDASVTSSVAYDTKPGLRKNPNDKVTGFNLLDKTNVTETASGDDIPTVGDACLGNGQGTIDPTITHVELLSSIKTETLTAFGPGGLSTIVWPAAPVV